MCSLCTASLSWCRLLFQLLYPLGALLIFFGDPQICLVMCETLGFLSGIGMALLLGGFSGFVKVLEAFVSHTRLEHVLSLKPLFHHIRVFLCHVPLCPLSSQGHPSTPHIPTPVLPLAAHSAATSPEAVWEQPTLPSVS